MKKLNDIAIVTPSYNQGDYIEKTFQSVLNQKDIKVEYLVMDAKSTDSTLIICSNFAKKFSRSNISFTFISKKDKGQANAVNKGWRKASGELMTYLNSDDYYEPNILKKVKKFFEKNPEIDWAFGGWNIVNQKGKIVKTYQPQKIPINQFKTYGFNIGQPSVFFRKSLLKKVGMLDENLHLALDYDLWLRFLKVSKPAVMPFLVSNLRYYSNAKSSKYTLRHNREAFEVAKKHLQNQFYLIPVLWFRFFAGWLMIKIGKNISQTTD